MQKRTTKAPAQQSNSCAMPCASLRRPARKSSGPWPQPKNARSSRRVFRGSQSEGGGQANQRAHEKGSRAAKPRTRRELQGGLYSMQATDTTLNLWEHLFGDLSG